MQKLIITHICIYNMLFFCISNINWSLVSSELNRHSYKGGSIGWALVFFRMPKSAVKKNHETDRNKLQNSEKQTKGQTNKQQWWNQNNLNSCFMCIEVKIEEALTKSSSSILVGDLDETLIQVFRRTTDVQLRNHWPWCVTRLRSRWEVADLVFTRFTAEWEACQNKSCLRKENLGNCRLVSLTSIAVRWQIHNENMITEHGVKNGLLGGFCKGISCFSNLLWGHQ